MKRYVKSNITSTDIVFMVDNKVLSDMDMLPSDVGIHAVVCKYQGNTVGKLNYQVVSSDLIDIGSIWVSSSYRSKGIGSKLINKVIKLSDHLLADITLGALPIDSDMSMEDLVSWYKHKGFVIENEGMVVDMRKHNDIFER